MTLPKRPKPQPKCVLCHAAARPHMGFYCATCEAHQRRAAKVAKRVTAGRKVRRLSPTEERGQQVRYPT